MTCSSIDYNSLHHFICVSLSPNGDYTMLQSVFNYKLKKKKTEENTNNKRVQ